MTPRTAGPGLAELLGEGCLVIFQTRRWKILISPLGWMVIVGMGRSRLYFFDPETLEIKQ